MRLDARIKDRKCIFDCFSSDAARDYIGKECYMTDRLEMFQDISKMSTVTLLAINDDDGKFVSNVGYKYRYCLPIDLVDIEPKEKIYRPYTLEEFIKNVGDVGACVRYKHKIKHDPEVYRTIITEIRETSGFVVLGNLTASFEGLFCEFEYFNGEAWVPFGVEK